MKQTNSIIKFILFMEEYLLWVPGNINTLFEKLFNIILRSVDSSLASAGLASLINPLFCYFLFASSATNVVAYLKSIFDERARADILIWLERNKYIRTVLLVVFALIFLLQVLSVLNNPSLTVLALYQDKGLWTSIFMYMLIKRFLSDANWS